MSHISYSTDLLIDVTDFIDLLKRSTLAERRPIDDLQCLKGMIENSNLVVSAWDKERLVGIARSMTDFHYACYLSDLAVDVDYQQKGIGIKLQQLTQERLGPHCKVILISAPAANDYYPALGYQLSERCWILQPNHQCSKKDHSNAP